MQVGLLVASLLSGLLLAGPSLAAPSITGADDDTIVVSGKESIRREQARPTRPPAGPGEPTHPVVVLRNDGRGTCLDLALRAGAAGPAGQRELELQIVDLMRSYRWCEGVVPPVLSPAMAAVIAWQELVELDEPTARIQPGRAVTGKPAFLEIGGPQAGAWHFDALGFSIDLAATSTYDIDWGDGTWTRGVTTQGGPWPDGTVHHAYTTVGSYTVTIHQHWSATYVVDGVAGAVPGTLRTAGQLALPVVEIQAVRNR